MTSCVFNTNEESYLKKDLTQSKIMNKKLLFVNQAEELGLIQQMAYTIRMSDLDIHPSKTCFLCVSPDYSAITAQLLSHLLSEDGEIYHIESVNVPFPDEDSANYREDFKNLYRKLLSRWENFVLIEAGVIRGGNYSWICTIMKAMSDKKFYTTTLFENLHSNFLSDIVCKYYDNNEKDLHFWWEQPNNHWKFYG